MNSSLVDTNEAVADNNWTYAKTAKAVVEIKDVNQAYNIYFKLRHTTDYRYANLFVLANRTKRKWRKHPTIDQLLVLWQAWPRVL